MWLNSYKYNAHNPAMYQATLEMSKFFENNYRSIENLTFNENTSELLELRKKVDLIERDLKRPKQPLAPKMPVERPMTMQEKRTLSNNIRKLSPQFLRGVL
jgi:hypothetical protein